MSDRPDHDRTLTGIRLDNDRTAVTIAEAARVLGLSTDAVRKRLQRGTIAGEKIGETWRVFLESDAATGPRPDVSSRQPDTDRTRPEPDRTTAAAADPLVETLREEVVYLREQLAERSRELAAERERFDVLHREALARIPALTAGEDAQGESLTPQQEEALAPEVSMTLRDRQREQIINQVHWWVFVVTLLTLPWTYVGVAVTTAGEFLSWDNLGRAAIVSTILAVPLGALSVWLAWRGHRRI